jgi:hypothetical protein
MSTWLWWLIAIALVGPFTLVILRGAPYLPTKRKYTSVALDMLGLKKGQTLVDLGCGDATVLIAAAKKGIKGVGYEINPFLYFWAKWRTRKYKDVTIKLGDMWLIPLPKETDGIYVFLIDHFMEKLDRKIKAERGKQKIKLVSFAFPIPGKRVAKTKDNLRLYTYG